MSYDQSDVSMTDLSPATKNLIDEAARRRIAHEHQLIELRVGCFIARTNLPMSEITLVHFKGQVFPQWSGSYWQKWRALAQFQTEASGL